MNEAKRKRVFLRLEEMVNCSFEFKKDQCKKNGTGVILNVSGGGIKMISHKELDRTQLLDMEIKFPFETLKVKAEVVGIKRDIYYTDTKRLSCWTVNLKFAQMSLEQRRKIIRYVHRCTLERHRAVYKSRH